MNKSDSATNPPAGHDAGKPGQTATTSELREELLSLQQSLRESEFPVIVVLCGVDGAGKGEIANKLHKWMDPRSLVTSAFGDPTDEELERPEFWKFWRALPANGTIGLFLSAWYHRPLLDYVYQKTGPQQFDRELERIISFERTLAQGGALFVKFWLHLSRDAQKRRFDELSADPDLAWRVTETDWEHWRLYDRFVAAGKRLTGLTDRQGARWHVIEGTDVRANAAEVGSQLAAAMRQRMAESFAAPPNRPEAEPEAGGQGTGKSDHPDAAPASTDSARGDGSGAGTVGTHTGLEGEKRLDSDAYHRSLWQQQSRLNLCFRRARDRGISTVLVFEGSDAAGKGGVIHRLTNALDARGYEVVPVGAPSDEERAHHYLWRFWRRLPRAGRFVIFDRSWYGRVLVERVEGYAQPAEWARAYSEIADFEDQLVEHGMVLVKFWLQITKEEQARRFAERERVPHKRWKLTPEDWRNRERWDDYAVAVREMIARTGTSQAPWTVIDANDKYHARIEVIRTVCERMEEVLDQPLSTRPTSS